MYHQKIRCEYNNFLLVIVATMLYNMSTNKYGFINYKNDVTIYLSKDNSPLLNYDVLNTVNKFECAPITFSEKWIQVMLNDLDEITKSNMISTLKEFTTKLILIIIQ